MAYYQANNKSGARIYCFEDEIGFNVGLGVYTFAKRLVKQPIIAGGKNNNKGEL